MGGVDQPFLYSTEAHIDARFPQPRFDPKAVTRASWENKPLPPRQDGPLLPFNRHPDAHGVPEPRRTNYKPIGRRTKSWIVGIRVAQLCVRVLQIVGAIGILVLMILIDNVDPLTSWVLRLTACAVVVHCVYGIYHLSRKAGGRTAASSAAYQLFSGFSDLCVLPLYAYGTLSIRNNSSGWGTVFDGSGGLQSLVPALYYTLVSAGGLHVLTLGIALWLGLKFRQITLMPPDMNPLEGHLTSRGAARQHKRNKSSVVTNSTLSEGDRPRQERGRSGGPHDDAFGQRTVPFAHTRAGSAVSVRTRDSRIDLPSRQFQGSSPPSPTAPSELSARRLPPPTPRHQENNGRGGRGLYTEIPLHDTNFPSTGTVASSQVSISEVGPGGAVPQQPQRAAKFTEAWYMSESLINRTQQRNRAVNTMLLNATGKRRAYDPLSQANDLDGYYHEDNDDDDNNNGSDPDLAPDADEDVDSDSSPRHPNPLRSNPLPPTPPRPKTPYRRPGTPGTALGEVSLNDRRVSGGGYDGGSADIADAKPAPPPKRNVTRVMRNLSKRMTWAGGPPSQPRVRNSSIQAEADFYSKPYGELKPATPPIMQTVGSDRHVSSGNDYDLGLHYAAFARRNVSGKAAEEGMAGEDGAYSRYSMLT